MFLIFIMQMIQGSYPQTLREFKIFFLCVCGAPSSRYVTVIHDLRMKSGYTYEYIYIYSH